MSQQRKKAKQNNSAGRIARPWGKKRWGQACLAIAVLLNSGALISQLSLNSLEDEYQELFEKEQYFIANHKSAYGVIESLKESHRQLNMLQAIRRIGSKVQALSENEQLLLANDELLFAEQHSASLQAAVTTKYLLSNDPPMDMDLDSMFARYSDKELLELIPKLDSAAFSAATRDKLRLISVKDSISGLKWVHSILLLLVSMMVIIGSALLFTVGETPEVSV